MSVRLCFFCGLIAGLLTGIALQDIAFPKSQADEITAHGGPT